MNKKTKKNQKELTLDEAFAQFEAMSEKERMKSNWQYAAFIEHGGDVIDEEEEEKKAKGKSKKNN